MFVGDVRVKLRVCIRIVVCACRECVCTTDMRACRGVLRTGCGRGLGLKLQITT